MGHLYPGMLDVSTDLTMVPAHFGGHVEVLEFDDLRVRVEAVTDAEVERPHRAGAGGLRPRRQRRRGGLRAGPRGCRSGSTGWSRTSRSTRLAYYHRGLDGEMHERLGAGMILGASLLTARGIPAIGEYELRTSLAMLDRRPARRRAARSPSSRRSTSATTSSRWATTVRRTWRSATAAAAARPRRLPRQARLGCLGRVRRDARTGHRVRHRASSATARYAVRRLRGRRSSPARCCRSATPPPASTSAVTRASGPTSGARPASRTTGRWASAICVAGAAGRWRPARHRSWRWPGLDRTAPPQLRPSPRPHVNWKAGPPWRSTGAKTSLARSGSSCRRGRSATPAPGSRCSRSRACRATRTRRSPTPRRCTRFTGVAPSVAAAHPVGPGRRLRRAGQARRRPRASRSGRSTPTSSRTTTTSSAASPTPTRGCGGRRSTTCSSASTSWTRPAPAT